MMGSEQMLHMNFFKFLWFVLMNYLNYQFYISIIVSVLSFNCVQLFTCGTSDMKVNIIKEK
jgi:hypothetical protein